MADSPQDPLPPNTTPDPLITEPELVSPNLTADLTLPPTPPPGRRAAAIFIFFTVTLDMLAFGIIAPVLPRLIEGFLHGDTSSAARMLGLFGTIFAAMQFFCSPILGSLSDRFGRRPIVLLSNFGMGFDYILMAWAPALSWLLAGRVISGLTSSSIPTAMAYMADVTPRERRAAAFGMLNAAFGIGFILGPAVGGFLGNINPRLPFWVAGGLSLINGMYGLFVLPESLSLANRSPFSWARANPIGSLNLLNRGGMLAISGVLLLGYIAQQVLMNVYVIYADYRYQWTNRTVGLSLAVVGIFTVIYGALLIKPVVAKLGERGAMTMGLIGGALGYSMIGSSKTGFLLWLGIPFLNMMSFTWPAAQSLLSRKTSPSEQGQLQGAINSLRGIAGLVGPGFFTYVFSKSVGIGAVVHSPGTPFYVAASMLLLGLVVAQYATRSQLPNSISN
jgi:DHA1 family tetracycline resistance protein-like MFS transporter